MLYNTSLIVTLALSLLPYARAIPVEPIPDAKIGGICAFGSAGVAGCKLDGSGLLYACDYGDVSFLNNKAYNTWANYEYLKYSVPLILGQRVSSRRFLIRRIALLK